MSAATTTPKAQPEYQPSLIDAIAMRLDEVHATLDLLYTLTLVPDPEDQIEQLSPHTLRNAMHGAMLRLDEAKTALGKLEAAPAS